MLLISINANADAMIKLTIDEIGVYDSLNKENEVIRVVANGCTTDVLINKKEFRLMTELDTLTNHIAEVVRKRVENGCK
jgi:hypothetical protein